ncbi:hypothetical protein [Bacillus fonticola]|nr:hypothetical protein [Bacillus fonticola]
MLTASRIGAYISKLRKENMWTQAELPIGFTSSASIRWNFLLLYG